MKINITLRLKNSYSEIIMMKKQNVISFDHRNGNLFIKFAGSLNSGAAEKLLEVMASEYKGQGNVFVNTEKTACIHNCGQQAFLNGLNDTKVPLTNLFFIGKKGIEFEVQNCKVIVPPKNKCCGKCKRGMLRTIIQ